jgi:small subunit ribosomal protein S6
VRDNSRGHAAKYQTLSTEAIKIEEFGDNMQRSYEVMFIVRPDLLEEDMDKLIATLQGHATTAGATVVNTEKMGKRRLAYDVKKFSDGQYVLFVLEADGKAIHELERRLRVAEPVIKYITVRTDEEQQRLDKVRKLRAAKVKRPPAGSQQAAEATEAVGT